MKLIKVTSYFTSALFKIIHSRIQKFHSASGNSLVALMQPIANYGKTRSISFRKYKKLALLHSNCILRPTGSHLLINLIKCMILSLLGCISLTGTLNSENGVLLSHPVGITLFVNH